MDPSRRSAVASSLRVGPILRRAGGHRRGHRAARQPGRGSGPWIIGGATACVVVALVAAGLVMVANGTDQHDPTTTPGRGLPGRERRPPTPGWARPPAPAAIAAMVALGAALDGGPADPPARRRLVDHRAGGGVRRHHRDPVTGALRGQVDHRHRAGRDPPAGHRWSGSTRRPGWPCSGSTTTCRRPLSTTVILSVGSIAMAATLKPGSKSHPAPLVPRLRRHRGLVGSGAWISMRETTDLLRHRGPDPARPRRPRLPAPRPATATWPACWR